MVDVERRPQPRNLTWIVVGAVLVVLAIIAAIWAYSNRSPSSAAVARRDIVGYMPLDGEVIAPPGESANVLAPYEAPIARVMAAVGQKVRRGEVIAELSQPSAAVAYQQARQAVQAAEAALASAQQTYSADLTAARQQLAQARAAEQAARQQVQAPPAPSTVPGTEEPAQTPPVTVQEPGADLQLTQARIAAEQAVAQAQAEYQAALAPYRAQLGAARADLRAAQAGRKMGMIRAPISGTVVALNVRSGETAKPDPKTPVATIVDLDALKAQAPITPEQYGQVKVGMPVVLTSDAVPSQQFSGEVASLVPRFEGSDTAPKGYTLVANFRNEAGALKPQMKATVSVKMGEAKNAVAVPNDAIGKDSQDRAVVQVLRNGQWQQVVVVPGLTDGEYTQIKEGVKEGETVKL